MRNIFWTCSLLAFLIPAGASAQSLAFNRPADAIKYRQGAFTVMGAHTQRLGAMAKGEIPFDKQSAEQQAVLIDILAKQLSSAFPAGSDSSPSKAKAEIWQDASRFKAKIDDLQAASNKLVGASKMGDLAAFKAAFSNLSQSCKSCHDGYRNR